MKVLNQIKTNVTPKEQALDFLQKHKSGVLATVSADTSPHASVIYYSAHPDFSLTFLTKNRTRKSNNLASNNQAMFVVYDEASQTMVQITGLVSEIKSEEETHGIFMNSLRSSLHASNSSVPPISKLDAGEYVAYRINPTEVTWSAYKRRGSAHNGRVNEKIHIPEL